jgi:CHAD domain-containing protein
MAYRLKLKTTLALEVRRIALEQIDIARGALARRDDRTAAVHDARRSLKRLRAMLRLVRPALGETWFKQSNRQLAGLGQRLSQSRDLDVMVVTLSKLENGSGGLSKDVAERLRRAVAHSRSLANGATRPTSDRTLGSALQRAEKLFAAERLRGLALAHVANGLEQSYRKARRTFREAYQAESDEAFHSWRKATQAHWRHMQLLGRGWPESIGARAAEAKELSRLLGEDHDLAVLLAFAAKNGATGLAAADLDALRASSLKGQRQIRGLARLHAERLFAERPRQLTKRILRYWKAAEQLSTLMPPEREPQPSSARPAATASRPARAGSPPARASAGKKAARRRGGPRPNRQ